MTASVSEKGPPAVAISSKSSTDSDEVGKVFHRYVPTDIVLEHVDAIIRTDERFMEYKQLLTRGALLANQPELIDTVDYTNEERNAVRREKSHPIISQPFPLFLLAISASFAAISFGNDESCVGGAQLYFQKEFNITNANVQGTVLAAPYLAAGVFGIAFSPLEKWFGRRTLIFVSCFIAFSGSLWQAFSNGLASILVARLYLGISMGISSIYVPVLVSESAPAISRGAFLMLWQTFVAFGVMLGSVFNRAFVGIPDKNLAWRLMIGSSVVAPVITGALIFFPPESPRWLLLQGRTFDSFLSLLSLRSSNISSAKDFYTLYESLKNENELEQTTFVEKVILLISHKRNRFALYVASAAVFGQQYGGVNILVSYTTVIMTGAGIDPVTAIAGSIGIGGGCFLGTFLSSQLVDRFGRRKMLLLTLPMEGLCLYWLGGVLNISDRNLRLGLSLTAQYVYVLFFSWGIGPISWTLVAEVFPLNTRSLGTSYAMSLNWLLDFVLSMTWPKMAESMTVSGGLYFYASWNIVLFFFTYFFIPETKRYSLEELDEVFGVGAKSFFWKKWNNLVHKKGL